MPVVDVRNLEGKKVGTVELADDVFSAKVNQNLLHETVRHFLAGTCAAVMVIQMPPANLVENRIEGGNLPAGAVPE